MHPFPTHSPLEINAMAPAETAPEPGLRSPFAASVVARAADLGPTICQALVDRLRDPLQRFAPEDTLTLLTLMREAASAPSSDSHWPAAIWCEPGHPIQKPEAPPGHCVLVAPVSTNTGWELHAVLAPDLRTGQTTLPAHVPHSNRYRCRSHDIFDVIMQTLQREDPHRRWVSGREQRAVESPPGLPLRRALAQWLETLPGVGRPLSHDPQVAMSPLQVAASPLWEAASPRGPAPLNESIPSDLSSGRPIAANRDVQGQHDEALERSTQLRFNGLTIDLHYGEVRAGTRRLSLTKGEYKIVLALARTPGRTLSRQELTKALGGNIVQKEDRSLDAHIFRIRRKLEEATPGHHWIGTAWGSGYVFVDRDT